MKTVSFWLDHHEGESRVIVEFTLRDGKVSLVGIGYIRGNVVSLNDYAAVKKKALKLLVEEPALVPSQAW